MLSKKTISAFSGLAAILLSGSIQAQQKNVLFIAVDDLRPELACGLHRPIAMFRSAGQRGQAFCRDFVRMLRVLSISIAISTKMYPEW